jgi:Helix-hairpin-helix motif
MYRWKLFVSILFVVLSNNIIPQTDTNYTTTEDILNNLLEESQDEDISSNLYDILEDLLQNPVNINTASNGELQEIPYIDFSTAEQIISHRNKYGMFFSTSELYSIQEISPDLIKKIIPFVTVSQRTNTKDENLFANIFSNPKVYFRSRTKDELQTTKGFTENKFAGSNLNLYNRIQVKMNDNYQFGILTDKDAGEKKINEFTSAHFFAKDVGYIKNLVVGDYYLEFGQGLALWNAYGFSKGADAVYPVKKSERKIVPYTSSSENNFLRGIAGTIDFNPLSVSLFYSKNKFDANIDEATGEITSTPLTGLHRTDTEISERKTGEETLIGGRIDFTNKNLFKVGILHYQSSFNHAFQPSSVYDINGNRFNYTSTAYDIFFSDIDFFGEAVYDGTSVASINNLQLSFNKNLQFVSSVRSYPRNFVNLHGFSFGERSGAGANEFGIYNGLKWRLPFGIINFYYDQFKFPYANFDNPLPSEGNEIFIELDSKPFNKVETLIRYKNERKELSFALEDDKLILMRERENFRFEITYGISKQLRWKTRFEYNIYSVKDADLYENGFLFFQDLRFVPTSNLNIYGRIVFFKTDSFNSAIYEYENDLTGILTNVAMYGEGIRTYLVIRYKMLSHFTLSCKYSETYKPKEKTLGSGYSEIDGNLDNRINLQLDMNF